MQPITVLVADDHAIVRQGFRVLLESEPDLRVVGEADNGRLAVQMARKLQPDVVLMDIAMPLLNGMEATRQILKAVPSVRVLALSAYNEDEFVHELTEAGVAGYLLKATAAAEVIEAIRQVTKGKTYYSPQIVRRLMARYRQKLEGGVLVRKRTDQLSPRENEVLQLVAEGKANKQIAAELSLSIKTVEKHRQRLMNKLHLHDVAGLTRYAISKGMIETGAAGLGAVAA